jgi:alkylation response protein AidB-like acyl-CoA dehydrogenase
MQAAHDAVQIHGAYGMSDEYHVERFFREAKMQEIVDGTSEIHQLIIARHVLSEIQ